MKSALSGIPFSPPVKPKKFRPTITWPASPKASVTIAKVIPVVRNDAAPTIAASKPLAAVAMIAASHHETISLFIKIHETYTPVAKYKA